MKALPFKVIVGGHDVCGVHEATHVMIHMPGPIPYRMIPVTRGLAGMGGCWRWNQDCEKPTFHPSLDTNQCAKLTEDEVAAIGRGTRVAPLRHRCHSIITDGKVKFCDDCTHELKGQTLDLLDVEW